MNNQEVTARLSFPLDGNPCVKDLQGTPSKVRSQSVTPSLSPSPRFREPVRKSKDDSSIELSTPGRPNLHARGLSLQMPPRDLIASASTTIQKRIPLSPQLDSHGIYAASRSPVLPRHSRGLDFSRACTNLHHSTLAEQASPDSSPTITQEGMFAPPRKPLSNSVPVDTHSLTSTTTASAWRNMHMPEKQATHSSTGSVSMMDSGSSDTSSQEDDLMDPDDEEDPILNTPQVSKIYNYNSATPFPSTSMPSPSGAWPGLISFHRRRYRKEKSRKSSSSASGQSTFARPSPGSPPVTRSIEGGGYFGSDLAMQNFRSRRESLSMGSLDLHISSGQDSGDESKPVLSTPGVIRRPVTRRSNLLPKPKSFARVRAALMEESAPVDSEAKREADVIRQVRESDIDLTSQTVPSSPSLLPTVTALPEGLENISEDNVLNLTDMASSKDRRLSTPFGIQATRYSGSGDFWNDIDHTARTPPPPLFFPHGSSSGVSDDMSMDSLSIPTPPSSLFSITRTASIDTNTGPGQSQSYLPQGPSLPSAAEISRRVNNKRRRDDDFDDGALKRRAVSPGLSMQNSPVLAQSPAFKEGNWWGMAKAARDGSMNSPAQGERSNSSGSLGSATPSLGPKRVGLQGMTDTNDGLMKMSIE